MASERVSFFFVLVKKKNKTLFLQYFTIVGCICL